VSVIGAVKRFFRHQKYKSQFERDREGEGPGILFYAEDKNSWPHLGPIVTQLTEQHGKTICYITSSDEDPVLETQNPLIRSYCIGDGIVRTGFFQGLSQTLVVMTMPSLESMYIKKSKFPGMHYAYVQHSMVSSHLAYLPQAFDHFDTILCAGPHHVAETRATEAAYDLPAKRLIEHGYCRLDLILADAPATASSGRGNAEPTRVLLAPTWGDQAILESIGEPLIAKLLETGHQLSVRPHPQTRRLKPGLIRALEAKFASHERCSFEQNVAGHASLLASDIMISDWSGAALEYAFGLEKPVLFLDMPKKINNPEFDRIAELPLEVSIREKVGAVVSPDALDEVPEAISRLVRDPAGFSERIRAARNESIFNPGRAGVVGANAILELFDSLYSGAD
jgi:hypothetical protein